LNRSKAQGVADAINGLIYALIDRCAMGQEVYDRYYVGVVGYGGDKEDRNYVSLGFPVEALAGGVSRPISEIARNPFRIEQRVRKVSDGTGKLVEETVESPVWFEPVALGYTPMCRALQVAQEVVLQFISEHPTCFPPVVFNVTDGAANDGDPEPFAAQLRAIACGGRNVMLFNVHVSEFCANPIVFANSEQGLPDSEARRLFRMSSLLTPKMIQRAEREELFVAEGSRGFAFNANLESVIKLLDIGTRVGRAGR